MSRPVRDPDDILIIRPSALGDVCRSVPVLVSLKRRYPSANIDWLVQDAFAPAIQHHPDLRRAIPFPRTRMGRDLLRGKPGSLLSFIRALRKPRYGLVVDAQGLFRSGFFAFATGAPIRVGDRAARENGWIFATRSVRTDTRSHTVDRMLQIAKAAGARPSADLRLHTSPSQRGDAERLLTAALGRHARLPPIVLAPTSRWAAKRWPTERYLELARHLLATTPHPIAVVGGPGERTQCASLLRLCKAEPRAADLVGKTDVGSLLAIIERARLVVANDSAALHMAVGFDRPIVALFGPTDTGRVGPYGRTGDVIQHPDPDRTDHKRDAGAITMRQISVREVIDACRRRL